MDILEIGFMTFLVGEIGVNWDGNLDLLKKNYEKM